MMAAGLLTATSAMAIGSQDNNDALIQDATTSNETAPKAAQPKKSNTQHVLFQIYHLMGKKNKY